MDTLEFLKPYPGREFCLQVYKDTSIDLNIHLDFGTVAVFNVFFPPNHKQNKAQNIVQLPKKKPRQNPYDGEHIRVRGVQ